MAQSDNPFRRFEFSLEMICLVVMIDAKFPRSLRNVEPLLHERGAVRNGGQRISEFGLKTISETTRAPSRLDS